MLHYYDKPDTECHFTFVWLICNFYFFGTYKRSSWIDSSDNTLNKQYLHFKD